MQLQKIIGNSNERFIIHGSFGNPEENWLPWLKDELEKLGCEVFVPKFPTPEGQSLKAWLKVFEDYWAQVDEDTIFVGHSLGPAFILNVLERLDKPVKACFFVAGFIGSLGKPEFDVLNKSFAEKKFGWQKVKKNCKSFSVLYSDNDPFVPKEKAKELASKLGTEPVLVKGTGHFNEKAGYKKFRLLLDEIKKIC